MSYNTTKSKLSITLLALSFFVLMTTALCGSSSEKKHYVDKSSDTNCLNRIGSDLYTGQDSQTICAGYGEGSKRVRSWMLVWRYPPDDDSEDSESSNLSASNQDGVCNVCP